MLLNMGRVKINEPKEIIFSTAYTVGVSDINYGGHLGNDRVLSIAHEARYRWVKSLGFKDEISISGSTGFIVADAAIVYKGEAFYGDELQIDLGLAEPHKYGMDVIHLIKNVADQREIARVKTAIIFYDYEKRKIAEAPIAFTNQVEL